MKKRNILDQNTVLQIEKELLKDIIAINIYSSSAPHRLAFLMKEFFGLHFAIQSQQVVLNKPPDSSKSSKKELKNQRQTTLWGAQNSMPSEKITETITTYQCTEPSTQLQHVLYKKSSLENYIALHSDYCWVIRGSIRNPTSYTNSILNSLQRSKHILFAALPHAKELEDISLFL